MKKYQIALLICLLLICSFNALSQSKRKTTPKVPMALVQQFITDEGFQDFINTGYDGNINTFIQRLNVRKIDLNKDGQLEYFLETPLSCGSRGCTTYVYKQTGKSNKYRLLFEGQDLKPKNTYTNGYRDLEGWMQSGADNWWTYSFKFDGNEYNQSQCMEFQRNKRGKVTQKKCD